jgi:hypothetical protein
MAALSDIVTRLRGETAYLNEVRYLAGQGYATISPPSINQLITNLNAIISDLDALAQAAARAQGPLAGMSAGGVLAPAGGSPPASPAPG